MGKALAIVDHARRCSECFWRDESRIRSWFCENSLGVVVLPASRVGHE